MPTARPAPSIRSTSTCARRGARPRGLSANGERRLETGSTGRLSVDERNVSGYSLDLRPGRDRGLAEALEQFGTIAWAEALQPAIEHAERGLEVDWFAALCICGRGRVAGANFLRAAAILLDDGRAPRRRRSERAALQADAGEGRGCSSGLQRGRLRDFYEGESRGHDRQRSGSWRFDDLASGSSAYSSRGGSTPIDGQLSATSKSTRCRA